MKEGGGGCCWNYGTAKIGYFLRHARVSFTSNPCVWAGGSDDNPECFNCPVYQTRARANTLVFTVDLRSKSPPSRWIIAGVALLMEIAG